jgi:hypothetical protein
VLCWNCNMARGLLGHCPHESGKAERDGQRRRGRGGLGEQNARLAIE